MQTAITGIEKLLNDRSRNQTSEDRRERLLRLIDLRDELAQVNFRISSSASPATQSQEQKKWRTSLDALDDTADRFMNQNDSSSEAPRILLIQARALEEIGNKDKARINYDKILGRLSSGPIFSSAVLALAQLEAAENQHVRAVAALRRLDSQTEDSRWLLSRFKLVWSLHNLALGSKIRDVYQNVLEVTQQDHPTDEEDSTSSDTSLREALWMDLPVFAAEAIDKGQEFSSLAQLDELFRRLTPDSIPGMRSIRGRMQLRLTKLLRSQKREVEMDQWIHLALAEKADRASDEAPRLLQVALEYLIQTALSGQNPQARAAEEHATKWIGILAEYKEHPGASMEELRKFLSETQLELLAALKSKDQSTLFARNLTEGLINTLPEQDARRISVRRNLGETLFRLKAFSEAEFIYAITLSDALKMNLSDAVRDLASRRLASRVAVLRTSGLIPAELKAVRISSTESPSASAATVTRIQEALSWDSDASVLRFELLRGLYAAGERKTAVDQLEIFVAGKNEPELRVAASALVVDTWIAGEDWARAADAATRHREMLEDVSSATQHLVTLERIEGDATFKLLAARFDSLEQTKILEIKLSLESELSRWLDRHPRSQRTPEARGLLARSACLSVGIAPGECDRKIEAWIESLKKVGRADDPSPLLLRAEVELSQWKWREAQQDLKLALTQLQVLGKKPGGAANRDAVEKTASRIQSWLEGRSTEAEKTEPGLALLALESEKAGEKTYRKRLKALRTLTKEWRSLQEPERLALMRPLARILPEAFSTLRTDLQKVAPLIPSAKWIQWRIDAIREFENHINSASEQLPFARIRVHALFEIAMASHDLDAAITGLRFSKDSSEADRAEVKSALAPLQQGMRGKVTTLLLRAHELSIETGVESSLRTQITSALPENGAQQSQPLDLPAWDKIALPPQLPKALTTLLQDVSESGNLSGTIAVLEQARQKMLIDESISRKIYSLSLLKAGYQAESLRAWKGES
jgi:hypothetical protein